MAVALTVTGVVACQPARETKPAPEGGAPTRPATPLDAVVALANAFSAGEPPASEVADILGGTITFSKDARFGMISGGALEGAVMLAPGRVPPVVTEVDLRSLTRGGLKLGDLTDALGPARTIKDSGEHGLVAISYRAAGAAVPVTVTVELLLPKPDDEVPVVGLMMSRTLK